VPRSKKVGAFRAPGNTEVVQKGPQNPAVVGATPAVSLGTFKRPAELGVRSSGVRQCTACEGFIFEGGNWHHSPYCPNIKMIWKAAGFTVDMWACPDKCEPVEMPSGWVHHWACPFWGRTEETPF